MSSFQREEPPISCVAETKFLHRDKLHDMMMGQMYCGVFVHWSVYHFGKSTSALTAAKKIHDSRLPVKYSKTCYITEPEHTASAMLFGLIVTSQNCVLH